MHITQGCEILKLSTIPVYFGCVIFVAFCLITKVMTNFAVIQLYSV